MTDNSDYFTIELPLLIVSFIGSKRIFNQLNSLKAHSFNRIYVSFDGSKLNNFDEELFIDRVVGALRNISKQVVVHVNHENLGSRIHCVQAINWFFGNEEIGVILEDDVSIPTNLRIRSTVNKLFDPSIFAICLYGGNGKTAQIRAPFFYPWGWIGCRDHWMDRENFVKLFDTTPSLPLNFLKNPIQNFLWKRWLLYNRNLSVPHWDLKTQEFIFYSGKSCIFTQTITMNDGFEIEFTNTKRRPLNYVECSINDGFEVCDTMPIRKASDSEINELCWVLYTFPFDFKTFFLATLRYISSRFSND